MIAKYICLVLFITEFFFVIKSIKSRNRKLIIRHIFNLIISVLLIILLYV